MIQPTPIRSALLSVYSKDGLEPVVRRLHGYGVVLYSTGGTQAFIEQLGIPVTPVESLTGYPSILDGRVKTLHPAVFGGILARRNPDHLAQLTKYNLHTIDAVVVDLYPFEDTVASTNDPQAIIEKIDIGGVSLLRAAAKNHRDVAVVASRSDYSLFLQMLEEGHGALTAEQRMLLARNAFRQTAHYDTAIFNYFNPQTEAPPAFQQSYSPGMTLRYGENPHQQGVFHGNLDAVFEKLGGKAISYNNLVDVDAALQVIREFASDKPTIAILKHTNTCGIARRDTALEAWRAALACDTTSAFGGIFIANCTIDAATASEIDRLFYEVLIAPDFTPEAMALLSAREQRILLRDRGLQLPARSFRSLLNGVVEQDADHVSELAGHLKPVTARMPDADQTDQLLFAIRCCKHLKSNAIALVKNHQLIGMGCGQPNRVDALRQAIDKARQFGFDPAGAVMASDAFFPFSDCVDIGHEAGIVAIAQPGGSIKDKDSISACDRHGMAMVFTGTRHFRH
jgi:phosphoribosylaminoimidazolecarboxamide formyltransferase/IMP cyclohydrolase